MMRFGYNKNDKNNYMNSVRLFDKEYVILETYTLSIYEKNVLRYANGYSDVYNMVSFHLETITEILSQERIILITALAILGVILLIQAIHNLVNGLCKPRRKVICQLELYVYETLTECVPSNLLYIKLIVSIFLRNQ